MTWLYWDQSELLLLVSIEQMLSDKENNAWKNIEKSLISERMDKNEAIIGVWSIEKV